MEPWAVLSELAVAQTPGPLGSQQAHLELVELLRRDRLLGDDDLLCLKKRSLTGQVEIVLMRIHCDRTHTVSVKDRASVAAVQ